MIPEDIIKQEAEKRHPFSKEAEDVVNYDLIQALNQLVFQDAAKWACEYIKQKYNLESKENRCKHGIYGSDCFVCYPSIKES